VQRIRIEQPGRNRGGRVATWFSGRWDRFRPTGDGDRRCVTVVGLAIRGADPQPGTLPAHPATELGADGGRDADQW
jgi:hypothetical protein